MTRGWFKDPTHRCEERFFDGEHWTARVRMRTGAEFRDPKPLETGLALPSVVDGWFDDPSDRCDERYFDGEAWTARVRTAAGIELIDPDGAPTGLESPEAGAGPQGVQQCELIDYQLDGLEPFAREVLLEAMKLQTFEYAVSNGILTVDAEHEPLVDELVSGAQQYAASLQMQSWNAQLAAAGRTDSSVCELCGQSPAARITLRRQTGMVVVRTSHTVDAVLCDSCAATVTKSYQAQTAIKGWTGVISAMTNPVVLASNAANRRKHKKKLRGE